MREGQRRQDKNIITYNIIRKRREDNIIQYNKHIREDKTKPEKIGTERRGGKQERRREERKGYT